MRGLTEKIWYARYIDWTITTPALLLTLLLSTGLPMSSIIETIFWVRCKILVHANVRRTLS